VISTMLVRRRHFGRAADDDLAGAIAFYVSISLSRDSAS
jgi:hypothetical protein